MSHLKRESAPNKWPVERKGTAYIVKPNFGMEEGIPMLIVLREIMKLAQNRREAKKIIHARQILVNEKAVKDEKSNVLFFDTLNVLPLKKSYRVELSDNGKFFLNEIKDNEAGRKIAKIINKKVLKGKKTQLNLSDGRNFISDIKCNTNDSVLINLKEGKIEKCIPLKDKAKAVVFSGKHIGKKGEITKLNIEDKIATIKSGEKEINILINQLMIVE
ncbi:30S ribosomal protein S4E [uncultured archaeon]|nr:30S ribosomal protein S4E [uncultured archaeon]